jgi:hypothetical protein
MDGPRILLTFLNAKQRHPKGLRRFIPGLWGDCAGTNTHQSAAETVSGGLVPQKEKCHLNPAQPSSLWLAGSYFGQFLSLAWRPEHFAAIAMPQWPSIDEEKPRNSACAPEYGNQPMNFVRDVKLLSNEPI